MTIRLILSKTINFIPFIKRQRAPIITNISIDELFPKGFTIKPIEEESVNGNISTLELSVISELVHNYKPNSLLEIGTFDGRTTINLAKFSPDNSKVYTLDLPKEELEKTKYKLAKGETKYVDKNDSGERFKEHHANCVKKITQLYGDSASFDFSPYMKQMDFIFIDGSHTAKYVMNDTEIAFKLLKASGGIMLWHDYGVWKDVTKVLNKYFLYDERFKNVHHIKNTSLVILHHHV